MRKLEVGEIQNKKAVIESGLNPGERVVTSGYYRLKPGSPVEVLDGGGENPNHESASDQGPPKKSQTTGVE